jgi:hypothetical protein
MLLTLEFLLEPGVNVVHCDMKPENVSRAAGGVLPHFVFDTALMSFD